jgi:CheY-like chemotaxis protein
VSRILLVEDDESAQALYRDMLVSGGHEVLLASNGQEAIELLNREIVTAVVTDLRMPLINGLRLIRTLRDMGDTVPIIAISGVNRDQLLLAQDYGANACLVKPVERQTLLDVLDRSLSEARGGWANAWIHPEFGSVSDR